MRMSEKCRNKNNKDNNNSAIVDFKEKSLKYKVLYF